MKAKAALFAIVGLSAACDSESPLSTDTFTIMDEAAFGQLLPLDGVVNRLAGDFAFVEGPVWIDEDGGYLVFSDIPADALNRWDPVNGAQTFRAPSGNANGNTLDLEGRLVTATTNGRVIRMEADGSISTVIQRVDGNALNSPNDVVVKSDGTIWFTDPPYGLGDREQEVPGNYVYRLDPGTSTATAVVTDTQFPNGLCFSPDERTLYVADSGPETSHIRSFSVSADGTMVSGGDIFAEIDEGAPDGVRCDELGNVWSSSGDGAQVFSAEGELIVRILLPEPAANLAFGGPEGHTVFFTARTSLYSVEALVGDAHAR